MLRLIYEGSFVNGEREGFGTSFFDDSSIKYEGFWKEERYSGEGKEYNRDGVLIYDGEWKDGKYHGEGTLYSEDGSVIHEGEWTEGESLVDWDGVWSGKRGELEIVAINEDTFDFNFDVYRGANLDSQKGIATLNSEKTSATYKSSYCDIYFSIKSDHIEVTTTSCSSRVGFEDNYYNKPYVPDYTDALLEMGLFSSSQQHSVFEKLVGDYYSTFVNGISWGEETVLDDNSAIAYSGFMVGNAPSSGGVIMFNEKDEMWAIVISGSEVLYFSNVAGEKNELPITFKVWLESKFYEESDVIFMNNN